MSVCFPETEISNTPEQGAFGMQLNFMLSGALCGFPLISICLYGSIVNLSHVTDATILEAGSVWRITFNLYIHITTS